MRTGKKISASSLLSILGVICFATVLVAAIAVTSTIMDFGTTTVTTSNLVVTDSAAGNDNVVTGNAVTYSFNANSATLLDVVTATVVIEDLEANGIVPGDVSSASISVNSETPVTLNFLQGADSEHITCTVSISDIPASATNPGVIVLTYDTAGQYKVSLTISGTA